MTPIATILISIGILLLFLCAGALVYIVRLLVIIARNVVEDNKRGIEYNKTIVGVLKDLSDVNTRVSRNMDLFLDAVSRKLYELETAIRQGQTGPMTLKLERQERKARGEEVPEMPERPRTAEENNLTTEMVQRGQ